MCPVPVPSCPGKPRVRSLGLTDPKVGFSGSQQKLRETNSGSWKATVQCFYEGAVSPVPRGIRPHLDCGNFPYPLTGTLGTVVQSTVACKALPSALRTHQTLATWPPSLKPCHLALSSQSLRAPLIGVKSLVFWWMFQSPLRVASTSFLHIHTPSPPQPHCACPLQPGGRAS